MPAPSLTDGNRFLSMGAARGRFDRLFSTHRIPLWLKLLYTLFVAVLVPIYWRSTPLVFLWFCNAAVLMTLAAMWLENSLLVSMSALAVFWPHVFWQVDFFIQLATGVKVFRICGLTPADYMFDPSLAPLMRFLSMQHAWVLYLLLWLLWRLGYDRRALSSQTFYAWVILLLTYALTTDLHGPAGNVNSIFGVSNREPQTWMAPWLWLVFLMVFLPVCHYGPLHFVFHRIFRPAKAGPPSAQDRSL